MSGNLAPILSQYDLYPGQIENIRSVKKLFTVQGIYALKETKLTTEQRSWFLHVIERLQRLNFHHFVSPVPAKQGNLLTVFEGKTCYLTPWLEETDPGILSPEERLIETAGALHLLTEKEQPYSDEIVQASYEILSGRWTKHGQMLAEFAAAAESKLHYSPFELSFLSCHREVAKGVVDAKEYLAHWLRSCEEKRLFRIVLCHGKLSTSHFVDGKLLNLEHATLDSPVRDLAFLLRSSAMHGTLDADDPFDWLQTYVERFPLRQEEKLLLAAYLLYPEPIYRSVREYDDMPREINELVHVERLEQRLRSCRELRKLAGRLLDMGQDNGPRFN